MASHFSAEQLTKQLKLNDATFGGHARYLGYHDRQDVVDQAIAWVRSESPPSLSRSKRKGKYVYKLNHLHEALAIRQAASVIKDATAPFAHGRHSQTQAIFRHLTSTHQMYVTRLDLKNFYETVDHAHILSELSPTIEAASPTALAIARRTLLSKNCGPSRGLPRGIPISSAIAEGGLNRLDRYARSWNSIWLYARFVDDILVVSSPHTDPRKIEQQLAQRLPKGCEFHLTGPKKTQLQLGRCEGGRPRPKQALTIDFLEYRFHIAHTLAQSQMGKTRHVRVELTDAKLRKIKTRVSLSFRAYQRDGNLALLEKRLRFLTSAVSFHVVGSRSTIKRSGLRSSYPLLDYGPRNSLRELDKFVRTCISRTFAQKGKASSARPRSKALKRFSFVAGFDRRSRFECTPSEIKLIKRCWNDE